LFIPPGFFKCLILNINILRRVAYTKSEPMSHRLRKSGEVSFYLYSLIFSNAFDSLKAIYPENNPKARYFLPGTDAFDTGAHLTLVPGGLEKGYARHGKPVHHPTLLKPKRKTEYNYRL